MMRNATGWATTAFGLMIACLAALQLAAADTVIWEIGKFDQSSAEFKARVDFADPKSNPTFTVGQSDPGKDWPAHQPGSENKDVGGRPHPYTVVFTLPDRPKGTYRLTISVLLTRSRVPNLLIEVNGKSGLFYFHRNVSYYPGDFGVDSPIYGGDQLEIVLPSSVLRPRENKLVLTALDDPQDGPGDSWLNYDALRLTQNANPRVASTRITVEPTIFYVEQDHQLRELTDVFVTLGEKVRRGEVALTVGRETFRKDLSSSYDFGQQRLEFAVPEFSESTSAQITVRVNGKTLKSRAVLEPKRKWTLYVVPHAHLDIGFTDYQAKVAEVHNRNIDKLIEEIGQYPDMRFSLDGSWIVRQYLSTRNAAAKEAFLKLVREKKMAVPVEYANLLTGYTSLEELIRSAAYTHRLHREAGIPFEYANITDIPAYTWSYASVLNALGVRYFAAAANSDRAPILLYGRWNEKSPFWWQGPDGNKVLMSYSRQYFQLSFVCGLPEQEAGCRQSLPTFLQAFQSPSYKPDGVLMFGSQVENTDLTPGEPQFLEKWNSRYAYPKMIFSTFPDYFHYIDQHYGPALETLVGDLGPYWEDGLGTDAWYGAINRSTQQRAPSAEKLSTIAAYLHKAVSGPADEIRQMWDDLILYAEHTFTSWGGYSRPESDESVRQLATKDQFAVDGRERVNSILDQSLSQLADQIHLPAPAGVVFNPLSWSRSGLVETDLEANMMINEYPQMTPVPVEVLRHEPDYDHVRFLAKDVPSLGYKCYQAVRTSTPRGSPTEETALPLGNVLENEFYRIEVDPASGAVASLLDKQLHRDLVDRASPYRLNQYLYVAGGDETATQLVYLRKALPLAKLTVTPSSGGRVASVRKTPYGRILTYQTSGAHTASIETDIMLFDGEKRVEFINRVRKEPVRNKEAVYFAFPFDVAPPSFGYEIQNGWVDPRRDAWKGACREWFVVQHWVRVAGPDYAVGLVPLDAPLVTFGDIDRGAWPEEFDPKSATVFSWVMNNYWHTDFRRVQSGDYTFRYALTSGRELTPEFLSRFGRAEMTPLELGQLLPTDKFGNPERPLTPAPTSFLEVDAPNVVVENWKAAEDGQGTILRLLEMGGRSGTAHLNFPLFELKSAWLTNAVEEKSEDLPVSKHSLDLKVKPHEILTLRLVASRSNP